MSKEEKICGHLIHPAASVFPLMEGDEFQRLVDSIAVHGVQNPIVASGDYILDGRNRLRAVHKLRDEGHKVDLPSVQWTSPNGMTAIQWIEAQNLDRRHLSPDAHAAAAAALSRLMRKEAKERQAAGLKKGNDHGRKGKDSVSQESGTRNHKAKHERSTAGKIAQKVGVSRHKAEQAVKLDKAVEAGTVSPEVQREVIAGKRKLADAVAIADARKSRQLTLADIDPMSAFMKEQREQRKRRGPTKQSENNRLQGKITTLIIDLRRKVEKLAENTSAKSNRRMSVAHELRRLADLLCRDEGAPA